MPILTVLLARGQNNNAHMLRLGVLPPPNLGFVLEVHAPTHSGKPAYAVSCSFEDFYAFGGDESHLGTLQGFGLQPCLNIVWEGEEMMRFTLSHAWKDLPAETFLVSKPWIRNAALRILRETIHERTGQTPPEGYPLGECVRILREVTPRPQTQRPRLKAVG